MSVTRSSIAREFPIPDREYRVSPLESWDEEVRRPRRTARPARRKPRRRSRLLPLLLGLVLFGGGFLLGRAGAVEEPLSASTDPLNQQTNGSILPNEPNAGGEPVRILGVPGVTYGESGAPTVSSEAEWNMILINGDHPLSQDFQVPELTQLRNGHAIDKRAYPELQAMMDAARAAGFQPIICSSYRTWEKQEELFERKVQSYIAEGYGRSEAEDKAAYWVARPGTSEHQAALAVDIVDKEYQLLDEAQEERPVQQWLMSHCAEYGFILRYPTAKSSLTGVGYEPWHYRYVGKEAAKAIMDAGICLEEYLAS